MNASRRFLRSFAGAFALALTLLSGHAQAKSSDTFADLIWIVQKMESANMSPFPVKSGEILGAKSLFACVQKDSSAVGVAGCLSTFATTPEGKKLLGTGATIELPPWLEDVVWTYVHIKEGEFLKVVDDLGEAAICIIAQVMAAGVDICGLIEDLVEVGKALLDAGKAVAKFIASVGEGFGDLVTCGILGDCGSGPPPEKVAYTCVFAPKVENKEALNAIEAVDPYAFAALRDKLVASAKSGVPCPQYMNPKYTASGPAAAKAAEIFTGAVQGVWTGHILGAVLKARDEKRNTYPSAQQVTTLANAATAQYGAKKSDPKASVVSQCTDDFGTKFGYAHVDRWLLQVQTGGLKGQPEAAQVAKNLTSNGQWCDAGFFAKNLDKFAENFRSYALANYCPAAFGTNTKALGCATLEKHAACVGLMKSVGQAALCGANVASLGKDVAAKVAAYFKDKGSTIACQTILPDGGAPLSNKPVEFACSRPPQQYYCNEKYHSLWKGPPEVLACTLPNAMIDPKYAALAVKVKAAVKEMQAKYPAVGLDKIDPLMVHAGSNATFAALKQAEGARPSTPAAADAVHFSFDLNASHPIDGVSRPTLVADLSQGEANLKQAAVPASIGQNVVKPGDPDPFTKPAGAALAGASAVAAGAPLAGAGAPTKPLSGSLPTVTSGTQGTPAPVVRAPVAGQAVPVVPPRTPLPSAPGSPLPAGQPSRLPAVQGSQLPAVQGSQLPAVQGSQLPAVQGSQRPAVQGTSLPAVQSPPLPAVQAPQPAGRAPSGPATPAAPNWSAIGQAGSPQPAAVGALRAPVASSASSPAPVSGAPGVALIQRELAAASCSATGTALRFTCTTRAGFDRCESMRRQHRVEHCVLNERR
jgi:hypothetical protein